MNAVAMPSSSVIGVVGSGAMGAGIAQVAAAAGHCVKIFDSQQSLAHQAIEKINAQFNKLATKQKMTVEAAQAASQRITSVSNLSDLHDSGLIIEAIVENLDVKRKLFKDLEGICGPSCIFATNTSSISITSIAAGLTEPSRLVGMHFFNPAPLMALVEIISGLQTDPKLAKILFEAAKSWGKTPVYAKSTPGFIVNRLARPFYAESLRLLNENASDCATIDTIMREAGGFKMGPFELMDMIGHDVNYAVTHSVWQAFYNDKRFTPSLIQQSLVEAGYLGRKTKRGFYHYEQDVEIMSCKSENLCMPPKHIKIFGHTTAAKLLANRLQAAQISFDQGIANDDRIAQADEVIIFETDGRTATQRAYDLGLKNVALCDIAFHGKTSTRMAITVAHQTDPIFKDSVVGLYQAAGYQVSCINDVAGMVVMRTVAMLANEAADAVNQGVCDIFSADQAMQLGLNYPCGPLAWGDEIGIKKIHLVLKNLALFYGEDRYRVSPLIQQAVFSGKNFHG